MQPKLSICIPTYNRAHYIDILLSSIVQQIQPYSHLIELIVMDNCSTDTTRSVVEKYIKELPTLIYIKNDINLGPDRNVVNSFFMANGEYVWIIGDDEILRNCTFSYVFPYLDSDYAIIHVASESYLTSIPSLEAIDKINVIDFLDKQKFVEQTNIMFSFTSGNILNKKLYLSNNNTTDIYKKFDSSSYDFMVYMFITYAILNDNNKFLYIKNKLVVSKSDNSGSYKLFKVWGENHSNVINEVIHNQRIRQIIKKYYIIKFFPTYIIRYRHGFSKLTNEGREFDKEDRVEEILLKNFQGSHYYLFFIYALLKLPMPVLKPYWFIMRVIMKIRKIILNE